MLIKRILFDLP